MVVKTGCAIDGKIWILSQKKIMKTVIALGNKKKKNKNMYFIMKTLLI